MEKGDLILISNTPWNKRSLFGYQNGDLALIIQVKPFPNQISLPSIIVYVFATDKTVTIPILYAKKIGE